MKTKILGFLALSIIIFSCTKDEKEITVNLKTSGTLAVKVTDNAGMNIPDTKVKLYDANLAGNYLDALITNSNGEVNFGELLYGYYKVVVDTPKVSGIKYMPEKNIQVISGVNKNLTINVQEYVGKLELTFKKAAYLGGGPFANLDVIIVPSELYSAGNTVAELITKAEFSGRTNVNGYVAFSSPSGRDFRLIVYNSSKSKKNALTSFILVKDESKKLAYSLDTSLVIALNNPLGKDFRLMVYNSGKTKINLSGSFKMPKVELKKYKS